MTAPAFFPRLPSVRVYFEPHLEKPRLEPERFSGGVNLSAVERNRQRIADASVVYWLGDDALVVPEWMRPEFEKVPGDSQ